MCDIKIAKSSTLKCIIDSYKDNITEGIWKFSEEGITMLMIDPSHIFVCEMRLGTEGFESYKLETSVSVGISFVNLSKVLKCSSNDDSVIISLAKDNPSDVSITFIGKTSKKSKFEIKLIEIENEDLNIPNKEFDCNIKINSKEFKSIISDLNQFGDNCTFDITSESMNFYTKGDVGTGNMSLSKDDIKMEVKKPIKLTFSIKCLLNFTKATSLSDTICLSMSEDSPMMLTYNIENMGHVKFYLAQKIENE
jgi:proliferating cell nuclear antigen